MVSSKPQLHVSMLNTLAGCGEQFKRKYGHRFGIWPKEERTDHTVAQITGITLHKAVEFNLRHMMENDWRAATATSVREVVERDFAARWSKGVDLLPEEAAIETTTYQTALDQTIALSMLHYNEIAPNLRPIEVEKQFVIELTDQPIDLAGTIDVIEEDAIHDTKSSRGAIKSARTTQTAMYCTAYKVENGHYPATVTLDVLQKLKTPKARPVTAIPSDHWIKPLFARVIQAIKLIEAAKTDINVLTPARPGDWICTKKFCPFTKDCEFYMPQEEDE